MDRVLLPGSVVLPRDDTVKARPPPPGVPSRFDPLDAAITESLARYAITVIGVGLGFIFFWFGALKFVSGMSPAEDLATRTIEHLTVGTIGPAVSLPVLATWERAIRLGLLTKRFLRRPSHLPYRLRARIGDQNRSSQ